MTNALRARSTLLLVALFSLGLLLPYTLSSFLLTGDLRDTYLPLEDFFRSELRAGRLPFWDPHSALGFPVLASAQIGFWYPPLLVLRVLPAEPAFAIAYVVHVLGLALGMLWYCRERGLSRSGALLAAIAFSGSGFIVGHLPHANILFGVAWLPWALLLTERLARTLRPKTALLLTVVIALSALAGHFHITALIFAFCAFRFFVQLRRTFRSASWQHALWTLMLFLGPAALGVLLLAAAQLFPTLELLRESSRGAGAEFDLARANQHSFPPWQLITFLLPAFYGFPDLSEYWGTRPQIEMTAWIGSIPLLLAGVGMLSVQAGKRARVQESDGELSRSHASTLPRFWTATVIVGFLLALGRWSPFRLIGLEPTLGIFSAPARYLLLTQFALAILAGIGLDALARKNVETRRGMRATGPGLFGILAAFFVVASFLTLQRMPDAVRSFGLLVADRLIVGKPGHVFPQEVYATKIDYLQNRLGTWGVNLGQPLLLLSTSLLGAGGVVLLSRAARRWKNRLPIPLVSATIALTAAELVLIAWRVHPRVAWTDAASVSLVVQALQDRAPGRLYVVHPQGDTGLLFANRTTENRDEHERLLRDLAVANIFTRHGISGAEWPAALDLAEASRVVGQMRDDQGRPTDVHLLDRLGIRYVAGSSTTPNLALPLPAREILAFPSGEDAMIRLWERPSARPRVELLSSIPRDIHDPAPESVGSARIVREHPQRIEIEAENPTPGMAALVLRDSFYPGWQATLDGKRSSIERADTLFRGVSVPPGRHTITFRYRPTPARSGLAVSAVSWLAVIAAVSGRRCATRNARPGN